GSGRGEAAGPAARVATSQTRHQDHGVSVTAGLIALEQARLTLRAEHDLRVDRGRLVREAVAVMLADLEASGPESVLVRRLSSDDEEAEQAEPTDADGPEETVA